MSPSVWRDFLWPDRSPPVIELQGVTQVYDGASGPIEALRDLDLQVRAGEIFGVIGRSGAGKSSLVRTINLLNRPRRGLPR